MGVGRWVGGWVGGGRVCVCDVTTSKSPPPSSVTHVTSRNRKMVSGTFMARSWPWLGQGKPDRFLGLKSFMTPLS